MGKKRKKDNDIIVSFVGGSLTGVTGSSVLISYPINNCERKLICLEAGMIQGESKPEYEYSANKKMVENIPVEHISNVFLLHSHVDHSGSLPIFCERNNFNGNIYCTKETMEITKELLKDSCYLHDCLIKYLQSKGKKPKHLYKDVDMYNMFEKMVAINVHTEYKLDEYCSYEFYNSGHVVGGTQLKLTFKLPNNKVKTLVYTSDLGSSYNFKYKPYMEKMDVIPKANMYIFEGTYSNPERGFTKKIADEERIKLKKILTNKLKEHGRVFFPSFSFGRTQELMVLLKEMFEHEEWFKEIPIYVDGKLTNKICDTYSKVLEGDYLEQWEEVKNWSNFKYNKEYKTTLGILQRRETGIYISSSGFIQAKTRSCDYVKHFLPRKNDTIVFVGFYGGEGSIGHQLINSQIGDVVKIDGESIKKFCEVLSFSSWSSHIQYDEILNYWKEINTNCILIHHSEEEGKKILQEKGKEFLATKNKTTKIVAVGKHASQFIL